MSSNTVYIEFAGKITAETAQSFRLACNEAIKEQKPETLYLSLALAGGENDSAFHLHGFLRSIAQSRRLIVHNIGIVDSAGVIVFLAGTERFSNPVSRFLFHGPSLQYEKPVVFTVARLRHDLRCLECDVNLQWRVFAERTKVNRDDFDKAIASGRCWLPEEAKHDGLIDDIRQFSPPDGAIVQRA